MIPVAEPNLTGKESEYVADAIASNWVSGLGPYVERFEDMVAKAAKTQWAVATITGTAALHAAMRALEFEGFVSIPRHTFVASHNVAEILGLGRELRDDPVNHDCAMIYRRDWPVLCDAAPAIGVNLPVATAYVFSFNGNKTITTGQGGAIAGDDPSLEKRVRELIVQSVRGNSVRKDKGEFNYVMPNLNAAMGCAQMERLDEFLEAKRRIWDNYRHHYGVPVLDIGASRWMCVIESDKFVEGVQENLLYNIPHHVCLPCSTNLSKADQEKVVQCVKSSR